MGSVSSEQGAESGADTKKQPLPLEIPVVATGARPGGNAEKRELFTEETKTVLVFETGGVIRLSAAVAVGQLVFLTNKQTGKEVVAQVLRKRSYRPTDCYVELDFTEPTAGFWGVEFPEAGEAKTTTPAARSEAADLAEAELTEEAGDRVAPPPDRAEVAWLRNEVEALKSQLKTMEAAKVESPGPVEIVQLQPAKDSAEVASAPPVRRPTGESASYPIRMQLPKAGEISPRTAEFAADSAAIAAAHADEHLLPKPNLDFEQFPGVRQSKPKLFSGKARRSLSGPIGAFVAVALLVTAAAIATYRMGWGSRSNGESAENATNTTVVPASSTAANPSGKEERSQNTAVTSRDTPAEDPTRVNQIPMKPMSEAEREQPAAVKSTGGAPVAAPSGTGKHVATSKTPAPDAPGIAEKQDDVVVPPKLLKAIRSLSPPEALRAYVSGVVTLDTVVDEDGRVQSATPVGGPKALYQKAVETVKDYVYQPATRNGKAVPAHVQVKIQFWYEP